MSPMKSFEKLWMFDEDDELTAELYLLGGLVAQPIAAVRADAPLGEARQILIEQKVPAVVVVDVDHNLLGLVTRTDVLRTDDSYTLCGDAMTGRVVSLGHDSTIECAAALMAIENVSQIAVTNTSGELVGLVSAVDIARHMAVRAGYLAA